MYWKRYIICIICICIWVFQIWFWQEANNDFEQKANLAWIKLDYIKQQPTISRYEVTRLLNAVECIDCINPSNQLINRYTNNFWINFIALPWKDFNDIIYKKAIYNNQSYYYCVATVADKEYMFWYPLLTSPLCPWEFCGTNTMSKWEFVQVITNILSKYIRKNYTTDWNSIKIRYESQKQGSYSYNIFNDKDKSIIINKAQQCEGDNCPLWGASEFRTYLKYCMFNLNACNMKELWRITQWYWPIAELNIAIKEWIIFDNTNYTNTIHTPIDGKTAIEAFWRIFPKIQCNFNNDYDCDGIVNQDDNCPNHYNPSQIDTDNDKIWDVCDNDIDGDSISNPIGIVDERWSVKVSLRAAETDNCIFIQNTNQYDSNNNYQWNSCDITNIKGVSIWSKIVWTGENSKIYAYIITDYSPIEKDRVRNIDGKNFNGKEVYYPIKKSGLYTLYVQSQSDPRRKASTSLIAEYNKWHTNANLSLSLSKNYIPILLNAKVTTIWKSTSIIRLLEWPENQTKTTENNKTENTFLIRKEGKYTLTTTIKNQNNETIAIASQSFIIENEKNNIKNINISNINPKIGEQITMNIDDAIKERKVNRWDSVSDIQSKNNISHTYKKDGIYIIESLIILWDNTQINDYKTIIISNKQKEDNAKILQVKPTLLEWISQSPINLLTTRIGYTDTNIIKKYFYDGVNFSTGIITSLWAYNNYGIYYPESKEILWVCQYTASQSTVVISSNSFSCLNMKINKIQAQCDIDWDTIDDRCDDDIDGDGVKNPIWLIKENHSSCDINQAIIDKIKRDSMMNQLQSKQFNNLCKSLDNCPLQSNADQKDNNSNWIWNQCENTTYNFWKSYDAWNNDSDHDWIQNNIDNCPDLQETYNWYQDTDWCPELWNSNTCDTQILWDTFVEFECLQCPCQYAQESADINPWDTIRASLRNISWSVLQSRSNTKTL